MSDKKKTRKDIFTFNVASKDKIELIYDAHRQGFVLPDADPSTIRLERSYDRDSGKPKVLDSIPSIGNFVSFDADTMLRENYDFVISIDTNTHIYNGEKISICTSYTVPKNIKLYNKSDGIPFNFLCAYVIFNPAESINPELIGWHIILSKHINIPHSQNRGRLAIVVDSEKDLLPKFNSRELPYFQNNFLHPSFRFCYASDRQKDSLSGQMLKMCHNVSKQIFQKIKTENLIRPSGLKKIDFCDGIIRVGNSGP